MPSITIQSKSETIVGDISRHYNYHKVIAKNTISVHNKMIVPRINET